MCSVLFTVATLASAQDTIVQARVVAQALPSRTVQSAPLQYISHEDIEARGLRDLYEAVKGFAGVNIRDYGGIGGIKTVSIRSLGTEHTAVSYDGATMSNVQSGQVDIGRFSLDNVETVSLSIGQSDDLFRAANLFASAGVLEIRSLKPVFDDDRRFRATAQVRAASFKTLNPSLILEQKFGERWSASVNADWLGSDGTYPFTIENGSLTDTLLRKNSDVKRLRCEANVYGNVGTNGELSFKANYLESERGLPGSVVLYNPTANERLWDRNAFAHIRYVTKLSQFWKLQANAKYSYAWTRYLDTGERYPGGKQDDRYTQNEWYASATALFRPTDNWTFSAAQDVIVNTLSSTIPECPFPTRLTSMSVVAGQYRGERLTVTADLLATLTSEKVQAGQAAPNRSHLSPSVGFSYKIFKRVDKRWPHTRRIPIMGLALCLGMAFIAERYFGIADITGAYVAGIILCNLRDSEYIAEKMDINSYMLFGPIFFASIGLKTDISDLNVSILLFAAAFVVVGLVCKIVGCGLVAKACRYTWGDSLKIGVGMMTRGEVALIVSQKGLSVGLVDSVYFTAVILLIITSSIMTPIILKVLYAKMPTREDLAKKAQTVKAVSEQ